jgi:transposase
MAKDSEKQIARTLYIDQCLTAKEIAKRLKLTEKTVGTWVDKGHWKELRLSKQSSPEVLLSKYNELLACLLDKRLEYERKTKKTDDEKADYSSVIDEMSKVSAMIDRVQKDGRTSLRIHIHCLEKFMAALNTHKPKLFMELIDYQKEYLTRLADELK